MAVTLTDPTSTDDTKVYTYQHSTGKFVLTPLIGRVTFSNAAYTAVAADRTIAQIGTLSAARVVTLPAANAVPAGTVLTLLDESGTVGGAWSLNWARAGSDTINGGTANVVGVAVAYGRSRAESDGVSKWTILVDYVQPGRVTFSNAAYTAVSTDRIVSQVGTLSAARTVTLPAASAVLPGTMLTIVDDSGTATPVNYIAAARAGSDSIFWGNSGSLVTSITAVDAAYGSCVLMSDGSTKWFVVGYNNLGLWLAPTLTNSWQNFGGSHQVAQYRKVNDLVYCRGLIRLGTLGSAAFTLPAGYRPPAEMLFNSVDAGVVGEIDVTAAGAVTPTSTNNTYHSLNGIVFSVLS